MAAHSKIIRPILFAVRLLLWISAVITLGLGAWIVDHVKGYRAVFPLVIAVLTTVFYIPSLFTACMKTNKGYMLPLDIVFYALWLSAFIFIAQTDNAFNEIGCASFSWTLNNACRRRNSIQAFTFLSFFWTLCGMCLEILNIYLEGRYFRKGGNIIHPEKPTQPDQYNNGAAPAVSAGQTAGVAPATAEQPQV
ncbi:Uncharacterized protein PECH_001413 [Penicillium ucsense]|uniref:MARVEL domain-containing protein n=1 Tax=Penicillium ucsense TaxID=2839758 RepID=A0A8J8W310_9EURO|nr:Uncharacterized protein PECM_007088 [Penicillium ucsense]KAF7738187.1 Uncharacterized protein PECH_001413 [Penicillium ucsense]